jgi:hypothetical protein
MAKKRKKDKKEEDEEYEFTPPDFDEKDFLKRELKDTKAALVSIGVAALFGVLAGALASIDSSIVLPALLLGVAGILLLKYIYQLLKVDISHFQKKNWVGIAGTFFFTFLAIAVLTINVPFIDLADPTVDKVIVWVDDGSPTLHGLQYDSETSAWTNISDDTGWDRVIHSSDTVNITAHVSDNGKLSVVEIAIVPTISTYHAMNKSAGSRYNYSIQADQFAGQDLTFYIRAVDGSGNSILFSPRAGISFAV